MVFFGMATGLLASPSSEVVSASVEGGTNANAFDPSQEAIYHIDKAKSALQNGDTEGAQLHLDSAKKTLVCRCPDTGGGVIQSD